MHPVLSVIGLTVLAGCTAAMPTPDMSPLKATTYEFDRDTQKWIEEECTTTPKQRDRPNEIVTVCYKKNVAAPPPGIQTP
jgi:hypothetical protein